MTTRNGAGKTGVGTASKTSASKAAVVRSRSKSRSDGTDGTRPNLSSNVLRKAPSTVGKKGTSTGLKSASSPKSIGGYSAPGHSGGSKLGEAPKLGTSSAVSGTPGRYGTAPARNNSQAGASGAVSGKSTTYGTAPAKNVTKGAYGTWGK